MSEKQRLEVLRIIIRVCDSCQAWFKLEAGPMACPRCGGETWLKDMVPDPDEKEQP